MSVIYKPEFVYVKEKFEKDTAVLVEDGIIKDIGNTEQLKGKYPHSSISDWSGLAMTPGCVNTHNHSFQSLLRGLSCDRPFLEWRDQALYKYSPRLKKEHIYNGAVFAFGEMMKYGVTTVCDFFYLHNYGMESDEMIIRAAKDIGIRLVLARTMYDWNGAPSGYVETIEQAVENTRSLAKKYKNDDMVSVVPAPHSLHAATQDMIKEGHKLARELGCCFHIHVAEEPFEVEQVMAEQDGLATVEFLDKIGVVDESMVIVHGVWLKEKEIRLLGQKGAKLAYCPSSNMFLADGITDITSMKAAGVITGLGTDGACSNNRISVFEEMRMAALLQKAKTLDALCINYSEAFKMGTENGGRILQQPVGKIEIGFKADFVGVKIDTLSMQPISEAASQLLPNIVYSMQPDAIGKVVVNGRLTVENGNLLTIPEDKIISEVKNTMREIEAN